jgi:LuxR family maltose regulon positive regulatory protein
MSRAGSAASGRPENGGGPRPLRAQPLDLKLRPPRPSLTLVERRGILATLAATDAPLVLLSAPAGTGKTLALLQWVQADGRPFAWITLDESDDDPVVLLRSLVSGLVAVAPVDPALLELLQLAVPPVDEQVVPGIVAALERAEPFILVLDDAQCLGAPRCWQVVAALTAALPPGAQMALGTRRDPPLPLAAMRAQGRLAEVRADDLALGRDEAAELLGAHGGAGEGETVDDATLDAVLAATEGWAAGLYLATLAGRGRQEARAQGSCPPGSAATGARSPGTSRRRSSSDSPPTSRSSSSARASSSTSARPSAGC